MDTEEIKVTQEIKNIKTKKRYYYTQTPAQVEAFKKEWDLGWDSHMIQKIENKRRYFEADIRI